MIKEIECYTVKIFTHTHTPKKIFKPVENAPCAPVLDPPQTSSYKYVLLLWISISIIFYIEDKSFIKKINFDFEFGFRYLPLCGLQWWIGSGHIPSGALKELIRITKPGKHRHNYYFRSSVKNLTNLQLIQSY